jgi:hypothetical protein
LTPYLTLDILDLEKGGNLMELDMDKVIRNTSGAEKYNIQNLSETHRLIMRLDLLGKSNKEIATYVDMSPGSISHIRNSVNYKQTKAAMRAELDAEFVKRTVEETVKDEVAQMIDEFKVSAMRINKELMEYAESETVRMKCAHDILDRAGYKPADIKKVDAKVTSLDEKTKMNIQEALREIRGGDDGQD